MVARTGEIRIGTSGYSFADWVGPFYPQGMRASEFLGFYAETFDTVELNTTYYRIPSPQAIAQMERKTPPHFVFVVKLNQAMTHDRTFDDALLRDFFAVLEPLKASGKYGGLLAQFPWGFKRTPENRRYLATLHERLHGEPWFVEFRHDSWLTPGLESSLRDHRIGYCAVDEPRLTGLVPPITMVTTDVAYVRFHGRNEQNWWASGGGGDRYDYDYKPDELKEWVRKVAELAEQAKRTYLFFNNCHAGQAARNAKLMQELLRQQGLKA